MYLCIGFIFIRFSYFRPKPAGIGEVNALNYGNKAPQAGKSYRRGREYFEGDGSAAFVAERIELPVKGS